MICFGGRAEYRAWIQQHPVQIDDEYEHPESGFRITADRIGSDEKPVRSHLAHDQALPWFAYGTYSEGHQPREYDVSNIPHIEELANIVQGKRDVSLIPQGKIRQQAIAGPRISINLRIEARAIADRSQHWYNVDDGAEKIKVTPTVA